MGVAEVGQRFTRRFFSLLWENPSQRKRWALRWRTEAAARDFAQDLSWEITASQQLSIAGPIAEDHAIPSSGAGRLHIPRETSECSIRIALVLDSKLAPRRP